MHSKGIHTGEVHTDIETQLEHAGVAFILLVLIDLVFVVIAPEYVHTERWQALFVNFDL